MKVGSTSAEIALSQICGPDDIITPITRSDELYRIGTPGGPRNFASRLYPTSLRRSLERRFVDKVRNTADESRRANIRAPRRRFVNHMDLKTVQRLAPSAR